MSAQPSDPIIGNFSDSTAVALLARLPGARPRQGTTQPPINDDQLRALAAALHAGPSGVPASEGDVARQALDLVATDPQQRRIIHTMAQNLPTSAERFDPGASIAVATAVLFLLQSYVHIERDAEGKWKFEFTKQAADQSVIKTVVEKLLALMPFK